GRYPRAPPVRRVSRHLRRGRERHGQPPQPVVCAACGPEMVHAVSCERDPYGGAGKLLPRIPEAAACGAGRPGHLPPDAAGGRSVRDGGARMAPIRILQVMPAMDAGGMETFVMNVYRAIDRDKVQFDFVYHYDKPCFYDYEIRALGGQ